MSRTGGLHRDRAYHMRSPAEYAPLCGTRTRWNIEEDEKHVDCKRCLAMLRRPRREGAATP